MVQEEYSDNILDISDEGYFSQNSLSSLLDTSIDNSFNIDSLLSGSLNFQLGSSQCDDGSREKLSADSETCPCSYVCRCHFDLVQNILNEPDHVLFNTDHTNGETIRLPVLDIRHLPQDFIVPDMTITLELQSFQSKAILAALELNRRFTCFDLDFYIKHSAEWNNIVCGWLLEVELRDCNDIKKAVLQSNIMSKIIIEARAVQMYHCKSIIQKETSKVVMADVVLIPLPVYCGQLSTAHHLQSLRRHHLYQPYHRRSQTNTDGEASSSNTVPQFVGNLLSGLRELKLRPTVSSASVRYEQRTTSNNLMRNRRLMKTNSALVRSSTTLATPNHLTLNRLAKELLLAYVSYNNLQLGRHTSYVVGSNNRISLQTPSDLTSISSNSPAPLPHTIEDLCSAAIARFNISPKDKYMLESMNDCEKVIRWLVQFLDKWDSIHCSSCNEFIAAKSATTHLEGLSMRAPFNNPGYLRKFIAVTNAFNIKSSGLSYSKNTLFVGFSHRTICCTVCSHFLGYSFTSDDLTSLVSPSVYSCLLRSAVQRVCANEQHVRNGLRSR